MIRSQTLSATALTAIEASNAIAAGELGSEELVRTCLDRIAAREPVLRAWAALDPAKAIAQARERDRHFARFGAISKLHGIPVGIKDMIDTADLPTQHNSAIYHGNQPSQDAACVAVLRAAGAVILGKTETVEFAAAGRKAPTTNPHDRKRTPGGSSSGSGAAVADGHVPIALGTQTGGSLIRPASFNGIFGMKPSWGLVNREGAKIYSVTFDTIGWYGRCVADLALVAEIFQVIGAPATVPEPAGMRIAICGSPVFEQAAPEMRAALSRGKEILEQAGVSCPMLTLDARFEKLHDAHKIILDWEGRAAFLPEYRRAVHLLDDEFRAKVENRTGITPQQLRDAYDIAGECRAEFGRIAEGYDAILSPAAAGEAPLGLSSTGDSVFNKMWTLLHVPCVAVPGFKGPNGMPLGLQLIGPRFEDAKILAVAEKVGKLFASAAGGAT